VAIATRIGGLIAPHHLGTKGWHVYPQSIRFNQLGGWDHYSHDMADMTTGAAVILATLIYKLACLTVGALSCAMGYQLFKRGIWGNAGDMESNSRI